MSYQLYFYNLLLVINLIKPRLLYEDALFCSSTLVYHTANNNESAELAYTFIIKYNFQENKNNIVYQILF